MRRIIRQLNYGVWLTALTLTCLLPLEVTAREIILSSAKNITAQLKFRHTNYIVRSALNLDGNSISIPEGSTLIFEGGSITNGTIIGNQTKLKYTGTIFSGVKIKGEWYVAELKSSMFADINKPDGLKDLFALSNDKIENTILLENGIYPVSASANTKGAIEIKSKSKIVIRGTICLRANDFKGCSVLRISDVSDIVISGGGSIIGDRSNHTGTTGEWGMGIQIMGSHNIMVDNVNVTDCWGDCIYIGNNSSKVTIRNCNLSYARRQGISVTFASNCLIENCSIHDIGGTNPEYAIDFEPNANSSVHYMTVRDCNIYNCKGGIIAGIKGISAPNASVGDIRISRCKIFNLRTKNTFRWHNCSNIIVESCRIDRPLKKCAFKVDAKNVEYKDIIIIK